MITLSWFFDRADDESAERLRTLVEEKLAAV
jgi:hypothetical protein